MDGTCQVLFIDFRRRVAVTDDDNVMSGNFFRAQPIRLYIDFARQVELDEW